MNKASRAVLLLALLAFAATASFAAFDDLGAGARDPGMGNAVTGLADDSWAMFYNPAGLAQLERPQLSLSYTQLYTGLSDGSDLGLSQFAYAQPIQNGDKGTVAVAFQRFALSSLYAEQSVYLSYAHQAHAWDSGSKLYWGANLKYLNHSFDPGSEASSACLNGQCGLGTDPVLSGTRSKSVPDADLGLMYRFPRRWQAGLFVEHLMQPNVGFAGSDQLPFNIHGGVSYKSLWMDLTGDVHYDEAPDGTRSKQFIVGAERYFPSLDYGQFGVRGSLGVGDQQWRQMTIGLSYRINKIEVDYGFVMPLGGISGTAGTHRVALTFHFGAPTPEDEITRELLGKLRDARSNQQPYPYEPGGAPHDLSDPKFAAVRQLVEQGHFQQAQAKFLEITKDMKVDDSLIKMGQRLQAAAYFYPDLPAPTEKYEVQVASGIKNFLFNNDRTAMLHDSYALSLNPASDRVDKLTQRLEQMTQLKAERMPPDSAQGFLDRLEARVAQAHKDGNRDRERDVLADIHELEPGNLMATERLGSLYYVTGDFKKAVEMWQKAMPLETNTAEQQSMQDYIRVADQKMGAGAPANPSGGAAQAPGAQEAPGSIQATLLNEAAPQQGAAPQPYAAPAAAQAASASDPREVADLYQKGVEHYARGEYLQAMAMFMRILQIDPNNEQAQKALERIQQRVPSTRAYFPGGQQ